MHIWPTANTPRCMSPFSARCAQPITRKFGTQVSGAIHHQRPSSLGRCTGFGRALPRAASPKDRHHTSLCAKRTGFGAGLVAGARVSGQRERPQRSFAYMPSMHSESAPVHAQAVLLFDQPGMEGTLRFERAHQASFDGFGRYPQHIATRCWGASPRPMGDHLSQKNPSKVRPTPWGSSLKLTDFSHDRHAHHQPLGPARTLWFGP